MQEDAKRPPQELSRFKNKLFQIGVIGYRLSDIGYRLAFKKKKKKI